MDEKEKKSPEIKIEDRRHRFVEETAEEVVPKSESAKSTGPASPPPTAELPPMDFASIVLMFVSNAAQLISEQQLQEARMIVDILGILAEKTKGNLTKEEADL